MLVWSWSLGLLEMSSGVHTFNIRYNITGLQQACSDYSGVAEITEVDNGGVSRIGGVDDGVYRFQRVELSSRLIPVGKLNLTAIESLNLQRIWANFPC